MVRPITIVAMIKKKIIIIEVILVDLFIYLIFPYSAQEPSYIIGKYLSFIREYASPKTHAVTPEPQEKTLCLK